MMDIQLYNREIESIFNRFPSFQKIGAGAYKPGLETMLALCSALGNPHEKFRSVHVAGTNGKGSTSHMVASALSCLKKQDGTPLKVGLYTSPHLLDFRERMKVSGKMEDGSRFGMPSREYVYSFLVRNRQLFEETNASFFEITTVLAFCWFAEEDVDVAVVECGLGGRLDATNIIVPLLGIITNIGLDHCEFLGNTPELVAAEKAGIMKKGVPVVVGERSGVAEVFEKRAAEEDTTIVFAEDYVAGALSGIVAGKLDLQGKCQEKNIRTVVAALETLCGGEQAAQLELSAKVDYAALEDGVVAAARITGLHGRWETLCEQPFVVCDTGHNAHGFAVLGRQIKDTASGISKFTGKPFGRLVMIFGVVADKDLNSVAKYLPADGGQAAGCHLENISDIPVEYYFVNAEGTRALPAEKLQEKMKNLGFAGNVVENGGISETLSLYMSGLAHEDDFVFIGGSTFVVAEALEFFKKK